MTELDEKPRPKVLASSSSTQLSVTGMSCGNCVRHVTEAIQSVPGVQSAMVSLDARTATVRWCPGTDPDPEAVLRSIEGAGYNAKAVELTAEAHRSHEKSEWQVTLWIALSVTAILMIGEWVLGLGTNRSFQWMAFILASFVQILAGGPFYMGAWRQLKSRSANMDTLVALGSSTAYGYSTWALLSGRAGHLYFMEAAAIITLVSLGHWLEARATSRASAALQKLLDLAPAQARRLREDGSEVEVPVSTLEPGDRVVLRPGDHVPADGVARAGDSAVNEAMLTGESKPSQKSNGSQVYAGTVNLNGKLVIEVTATGEQTSLASVIAAVQRAQTSRANIQRLGDRVSALFVPIVVTVALAAGLWWGFFPESARSVHDLLSPVIWHSLLPAGGLAAAFIIPAAVLIVACPCAMGLATPAAIMASANAAAERGILIRDGIALEKAGQITAVLFDKTGTLTTGNLEASLLWDSQIAIPNPGMTTSGIAAAVARSSNHPVSQAVTRLSGEHLEFKEWSEVSGGGVRGKWSAADHRTHVVRLGSLRWLPEEGVNLEQGNQLAITKSAEAGTSLVGLAVDSELHGIFSLKDPLKPRATEVVGKLQRHSLKIFLVTGDNSATAASIARQAGIAPENVFSEVRPEQKADCVRALQEKGERVAFVGSPGTELEFAL